MRAATCLVTAVSPVVRRVFARSKHLKGTKALINPLLLHRLAYTEETPRQAGIDKNPRQSLRSSTCPGETQKPGTPLPLFPPRGAWRIES